MRELSLAQLPHPPENKTSRSKLPTINSLEGAMFRIRIHSFRIFLGLPDPDQSLFARIRILSFTLLQVLSGRENACKIKFQ